MRQGLSPCLPPLLAPSNVCPVPIVSRVILSDTIFSTASTSQGFIRPPTIAVFGPSESGCDVHPPMSASLDATFMLHGVAAASSGRQVSSLPATGGGSGSVALNAVEGQVRVSMLCPDGSAGDDGGAHVCGLIRGMAV